MTTKGEKIRRNIEDSKHPDELIDGEFNGGLYIAYAARLLMEAGDESELVASSLKRLQDNPREQIAMSMEVSEAVELKNPEIDRELTDLGLSGAFYIRACRYAAAAIYGADTDHD